MKRQGFGILLTMLMSMTSIVAFAYNAKVNGIYYNFSGTKATVTYLYSSSSSNSNRTAYSGDVVIPETVTYNGTTYTVTSIGSLAFEYCSGLTSVTIGNSVTSIGGYAFYNCSSLTSVTIPNSVTSIGGAAFADCSALTSVTIPNSVTSIGSYAFNGTAWYNNQPDGLVYAGKVAYKYKGTMPSNTSIVIEEGTLGIADQAFYGCSGLTSVTIGNSVTSIGGYAFYNCSSLTSVTIPNSVTSIGGAAFSGCRKLTSVTIPNSVTSIGNYAFEDCSKLTSVTIPNSVTSIGEDAFYNCSGLTSVTIPNSVTSIGNSAFLYCSSMTSINIPNSVTSIGDWAFSECSGLTSVTIPNSVTSIGDGAFYGCSGLTSIVVGWDDNSIPAVGNLSVDYTKVKLYVPKGTKTAYQAVSPWSGFGTIIEYEKQLDDLTVTDVSAIDNVISMEPFEATKGRETTVSLKMKNTAAIRGFQFDMQLPLGVTVAKNENNRLDCSLNSQRLPENSAHTLTVSELEDGSIRFLCGSQYDETFTGTEGDILTVRLYVDEDMFDGLYKIVLKDVKLTETDISKFYTTEEVETTVTVTGAADGRVVLDETSTTAPDVANGVDVRVKRTINAGEWSTICLPFAMTAAQCQAAFGSDVEIGDFTGYTYNSDEDKITVNFSSVTAIEANHPYIIKVSAAVTEFTVDGVDVNPADDPRVTFRADNKKLKDFVGTYVADFDFYNDAKYTPLFLSGNKFWYATESTKHMKAFRAYFDFVDMLSEVDAARVAIAFDEATVINDVRTCSDDRYYNLSGQQVETPTKGVYVKNGKKVIVK